MAAPELINILAVAVLLLFLIALIYLIVLLHRANRILGRMEHLSTTFRSFVSDIVPAIVNFGTIATALESVLRTITGGGVGKKNATKGKK